MMMDKDSVEGTAQRWAGKAQETVGKALDDPEMQAAGAGRQLGGLAQEAYGDTKDTVANAVRCAGKMVEQQPLTALLAVGVAGYLLGRFSSWR